MVKKLTISFAICFLILNICVEGFVNTKDYLNINVPSAIVIDHSTHRILFEKNAYEQRSIASLTKVMTCIMLVENCKLNDIITAPDSVKWIGGSLLGLKPGDNITAYNLLVGMLLPSGNDAAYTAGIHIGGSIERFGEMMTEKAKKIGAMNSSFKNPHGLDEDGHYSTAYDMALITSYALENETINKIVNSPYLSVTFTNVTKTLKNTNSLLRDYAFIDGVKTGFTGNAQRCLIASGAKEDFRLIAVVLGALDTKTRFYVGEKLLEKSFEIYENKDLTDIMKWYIKIPINKGEKDLYETTIFGSMIYPLMKEEMDNIYVKLEFIKEINPPLKEGTYIGNIKMFLGDEEIYFKDVYLEEDINKKTTLGYFKDCLELIFKKRHVLDILY